MHKPTISYDWSAIIEQLIASGHTTRTLSKALEMELSERALAYYRRGYEHGKQPLYWRGERLLLCWCETFSKSRDEAPKCEVRRGHRADRRHDLGPQVQSLPQWPPVAPVSVAPIKRKPGRPRKVAAESVV